MNPQRIAIFGFALFILFSCNKSQPPVEPAPGYEIYVKNEYFDIQARYALFLSNEDGETVAFRWLPGEDTTIVQVPGSKTSDRYDCTILKIATLEAPGSGVKDTTLTLTTYTQLASGEQINLRDQYFHQVTTLKFTLTNFNTLDSITVSDGLTISRPQAGNNYYGEYLVNNTGQCWIRVLVDGEPFWRYFVFKNVGTLLDANQIDVKLMVQNLSAPLNLGFPFTSTWQYKLDGVVDTSQYKFFPLSEIIRAPGGPVPVFNSRKVFEPVNNDQFDPNRPYTDLFRLQAQGPAGSTSSYTYWCDNFYASVPGSLPVPDFDLEATTLANNRAVAVTCVGNFDLLAFARSRTVTPRINWEVTVKPTPGIVLYRLPDVPEELGRLYPSLKSYDFNTSVKARAEKYERLDYESAVHKRLLNADPLWQARGGYLGREESF